jgi:succinate dehydrogenase/fumarate reductase flavoprotein subunit
VTLRLEGTVRGTGGLRIVDESCATSVRGLYAAGDAATRELICGGFTGGGSHNAAWAMSSGAWAGASAADFARQLGQGADRRAVSRAGGVALASRGAHEFDPNGIARAVQAEVAPYDKNYFRSGDVLVQSLERLDAAWRDVRASDAASLDRVVKARESAAMLATARWMYRSALARTETRGMHKREDFPQLDPAQRHHIAVGGLDEIWTRAEPASRIEREEVAA